MTSEKKTLKLNPAVTKAALSAASFPISRPTYYYHYSSKSKAIVQVLECDIGQDEILECDF